MNHNEQLFRQRHFTKDSFESMKVTGQSTAQQAPPALRQEGSHPEKTHQYLVK
jgi:hypothetical protein